MDYIIILIGLSIIGLLFFIVNNKRFDNNSVIKNSDLLFEELNSQVSQLEKEIITREAEVQNLNKNLAVANTKIETFDQLKTEKTQFEERLKQVEIERNNLKNETTSYKNAEEGRQKEASKHLAAVVTLQESLDKEKERFNDERINDKEAHFEKMKSKWSEHEKDVQNHLQIICKNNIITYISQEDFPHPRNKPDSSIEIMDQLIVFDAKSPANDDLSNFPKYIKLQTENLKKYAKHEDVKNDLFLVIPSNTLEVINQFYYNIGDYNVFIITKDALEPIILSLKKVEEYEFADKLSPEDRDNVCRIIGKFAHTTKRRIQVDEFFAREFLDTLSKAGSQLPRDILENVIKFESAEKLNPPMEKRNKSILTKDLKDQVDKLEKEMQLREIPKIENHIDFDTQERDV
jgi:hypothetical protein